MIRRPDSGQRHGDGVQGQADARPDPVESQPEHQHHHDHLHHTAFAERDRSDDVVYAKDASFEKGNVPDQTPLDHTPKSHSDDNKDVETADNYPAQRSGYRRVLKHWRHFVHAVIWLLFTG